MKSTRALYLALLMAIIFLAIASCQKEISFQNSPGYTGYISGWSFAHSGSKYKGCIGSAYYEMINGIKTLSIKGSDNRGNNISILIPAPDGKLAKGNYSAAQGAALAIDSNSHTYISDTSASSFLFTVTAISDTSIEATFTASLKDISNSTYTISSGSIAALVGKNNYCVQTSSDSNGGTSGGTSTYSLKASGNNCAVDSVGGNYNTGVTLTNANTITIKVDVIKIGTWSITTGTVNGIKFSGTGTFTTTGVQTILLTGNGKPVDVELSGFEITAGSTTCTFYIPIIAPGNAPCNPADSTAEFSGLTSDKYTHVAHNPNSSYGGYTITAKGNKTEINLQFKGPNAPTSGVYHVKSQGNVKNIDDVAVHAIANNISWQSSQGNVYVTINNGKITAVICSLALTNSQGGSLPTTKLTAKIIGN